MADETPNPPTAFQQFPNIPDEVPELPGADSAPVHQRDPRLDRIYQKLEEAGDRTSKLFDQRQAALAPLRENIIRSSEQPLPQPPTLEMPQKFAGMKNSALGKDLSGWMAGMMLVAGIGAMRSRTAAITGLNAMAGALDGLKQGNDDAWKRNAEQWKLANQTIIETNKAKNEQYRAILENRKLDLDVKMAQLQAVASEYQDQVAYETARRGDLVTLGKLLQSEEIATLKIEQRAAAIEQRMALALAKAGGGADKNAAERSTEWYRRAFGLQPGEPFTPEQQKFMLEHAMQARDPVATAQGGIKPTIPTQPAQPNANAGASKEKPLPLPEDRTKLKPGMWYTTTRGVLFFDGAEFQTTQTPLKTPTRKPTPAPAVTPAPTLGGWDYDVDR